jgi:Concanavalin A-like lectin/glucanases superfamily
MSRITMKSLGFAVFLVTGSLSAQQPLIKSFTPNGGLVWTNPVPGNISVIERSTNLVTGAWSPFFYDWATNGTRTTPLPASVSDQSYFRIGVQTNIPDPSLVMHLSFDNYLPDGAVLDISGHGNHGYRYSATNWPTATNGVDGLQAAYYRRPVPVMQGDELHNYGDYIAVTNLNGIEFLTNGTISVWAWFDTDSYAATALVDAGYDAPSATYPDSAANSWHLGRSYTSSVRFIVNYSGGSDYKVIFPDDSIYNGGNSTFATANWHLYGVSWSADSNRIVGYYDGRAISTNTMSAPFLRIYSPYHWLAVGCRIHEGSPGMDYGLPNGDMYPNNGWMGGRIDDVRIYNRALTDLEVSSLYKSFDKLPPSMPTILTVETNASSLLTLHWGPSADLFGIDAYQVLRDGVVVAETTNTLFFDTNLTASTTYSYSVRARDPAGHLSAPTASVTVTTRASGGGVDLILDDAYGAPWITPTGAWTTGYATNAVLTGVFGTSYVGDDRTDKGKTFTFAPPLPESGNYNIYIWYPGRSDLDYLFSPAVPVDVVSAGVTNTVSVNQQEGFGQWRLLGNFPLSPGAYVRIRTDGTSTSHYVLGDAVRFVK